jgi:excisionase family DNA binding protein
MPEAEPLLTPAEVATMFRVDPKTVVRWAKAGRLTSVRTLGGHRRFREREVRALLTQVPEQRAPLSARVAALWPVNPGPAAIALRKRIQAGGITTIADLAGRTADELAAGCRLHPEQVDEVRLRLARKGLTLRGETLGKVA